MWYYNDRLYHHGVPGMKWGVRRANRNSVSRSKSSDHEDYRRAHNSKSINKMSDAELRNRNNRLQMERQYEQLSKKTNKGAQAVKKFVSTAGTLVAVKGAYDVYKKLGISAIGKVGNILLDVVD